MNLQNSIIAFFVGGMVTTLITRLELSNIRIWSGVAALFPVFTLISYLVIGYSKDGLAVSQHAKFVLLGTVLTWMPYMLTIIIASPILGPFRAIGVALIVFCVLCSVFVFAVEKLQLFN